MASPPLSRDLNEARKAFESGNIAASIAAHSKVPPSIRTPAPKSSFEAQTVPQPSPLAEGGKEAGHKEICRTMDSTALISSFAGSAAAVAGVVLLSTSFLSSLSSNSSSSSGGGGKSGPPAGSWVPAVAFSWCTALGLALTLSFAFYLYLWGERKNYEREERRERWEWVNFPQGEQEEMVQLYMHKGLQEEDARAAITALSKHSDFFVEIMMSQELGLTLPDCEPRVAAWIAFRETLLSSLLPLLLAVLLRLGLARGGGGNASGAASSSSSSSSLICSLLSGGLAGAAGPSCSAILSQLLEVVVFVLPLMLSGLLLLRSRKLHMYHDLDTSSSSSHGAAAGRGWKGKRSCGPVCGLVILLPSWDSLAVFAAPMLLAGIFTGCCWLLRAAMSL